MYLRSIISGSAICVIASGQGLSEIDNTDKLEVIIFDLLIKQDKERSFIDDITQPFSLVDYESINDFVLRPKPWWLRIVTKDWQWVAIDPKIYHPPHLDPLKYPAIIEHEKVHLYQQRKIGKFRWIFKYITNKNFRFNQEMEPIVVELSNMPLEVRKQLAIKYANNLSGKPYSQAAQTFELALDGILSKAEEMGVETE